MRKEIIRIFATMAVVFLVVSALWASGTSSVFELESLTPTRGATGVPIDQVLTATFNQELDCSTVTASTFTLQSGTGHLSMAVAGIVGCLGTTATFTPSSDLAANTNYTATISGSVKDVSGQRLGPQLLLLLGWSFKTGSTLAPPLVTSVTPRNNAVGVPLDTKITATFDQAMNAATVIASFTLTAPGPTPVSGIATYDAINNILTFTLASNLAPLTTFTATVTTGATDLAGKTMVSNFVWTFKTGDSKDVTPPSVVLTNPLNGATSVLLNQIITATFSEPMNSGTINTTNFTLQLGSTPVAGAVTYAANTASFKPSADLLENTTYNAHIWGRVADLAGNQMGPGYYWSFKTGSSADTTLPTVESTTPVAYTSVCSNAPITATFSKPMDSTTINTGTFTLAGPSPSPPPVTGTVSLDITGLIATFVPLVPLVNGDYTAEITTGVTDLAGNALAVDDIWQFAIVSSGCQPVVPLLTAGLFGAFGGYSGITNQGINTEVIGDIGTTAVSTKVTGFHDLTVTPYVPPSSGCTYTETPLDVGLVTGVIDTAAPPPNGTCPKEGTSVTAAVATQALADATTAYNYLAGLPATGGDPTPSWNENLGSIVGCLAPGVYKAHYGYFTITGGNLTLCGSATAVWVFQMASSLTVGVAGFPSNISVLLTGGASAGNVFWQVGSAATINYGGEGTMSGTIIAYSTVTISNPGNATLPAADNTVLNGRAISLTGSVTMVQTTINTPAP